MSADAAPRQLFTVDQSPTYEVRISIDPHQDDGHATVRFRYLCDTELEELFDQDNDDIDLLDRVIDGWSGIDAEYSVTALATLLENYPAAQSELLSAMLSGRVLARRNNLRLLAEHLVQDSGEIEQLAAFGITTDDVEPLAIWPCNLLAARIFCASMTQWRMGMNGPIGLDYASILAMLDLHDVPRDERLELFGDIQTMEQAALKGIHTK